jgi:dienelactone hydrolase
MSCPDCFKGGVHNHKGEPKGHEVELYGIRTYITGPSLDSSSQSTIIYFCDAFGLDLINNKLLADRYAAGTGLRVLAPAVIPGGPVSIGVMNAMEVAFEPVTPWWNIWGYLKRLGGIFTTMRLMVPFFIRANPQQNKAWKPILEYTRNVKRDLAAGSKLGVCGFCWGGHPSTRLCAQSSVDSGTERLVDAQFCAHPSALKAPDDIVNAVTKFKVPYSMAIAAKDFVLKKTQVEETEAILRQKTESGDHDGCQFEIKYYEGCQHGFAVRAKPGDKVQEKAADDACEQAIAWFKKWL